MPYCLSHFRFVRCRTLIALLAVLLFSGTQAQAESRALRIGTSDWAPYVEQQRSDGGALARLISAVFAESGHAVEFVFYPWDRNVLMLQRGALHAIMPYNCSPSRLDYGICSDPLVHGEVVLFQRRNMAFDWQSIDDLRPYLIGTDLGYSYGAAFDEAVQAGRLRIEQNSKEGTGLRLLELKRIDLYPQDRAVGYAMLRRQPSEMGADGITHHPRYLNREPLRLLFRKDDAQSALLLRQFNAGLRRFAERGELQRLQQALNSGNAEDWRPDGADQTLRD